MSTSSETYSPQILVAYDFSETSEFALTHGLNLASQQDEVELSVLVSVNPDKGLGLRANEHVDYQYTQEVQELAVKRIDAVAATLGGRVTAQVHVRIGDPATQILGFASEIGANLLIVGSHGRTGLARTLLGSVSEEVARKSLCPVLIARENGYPRVSNPKVVEVERADDTYVPPHRYHYHSDAPLRPKAWALY